MSCVHKASGESHRAVWDFPERRLSFTVWDWLAAECRSPIMAAQAAIAVHAVELVREQADVLRAATLRLTDLLSRRQASEPDQRRLFAKDVVIDEAEQIRNSVDEILQVVRESKLQQIVTVLGKVFVVHLIRIWQCICRI